MNCLACRNRIIRDERLFCSACRGVYHYTCLAIPDDYYKNNLKNASNHNWRCTSCNTASRRNKSDGTPVRRSYEDSPPLPSARTGEADMSICVDQQTDKQTDSTVAQSALASHNLTMSANAVNSEFNLDMLASLLDQKLADVKQNLAIIDSKIVSTKQEIFKEMNNEFTRVINRIQDEFSETTDFISEQIKGFQVEMSTVNKKIKALEQENSRLNAELVCIKNDRRSPTGLVELQKVVEQLQTDLSERDQTMLLNDIEISGVPENLHESPIHITQALAQKVGMTLDTRDIISVERVGPPRTTITSERAKPRPRPLVARLARRPLRDELLRSARVRRNLDSSNIGLPEHDHCAVYINERLTKANRRLLWKTRQAAGATGWKFVWTRDGRIYVKKGDSGDSTKDRIQSDKDIIRVFGIDPTSSSS